MRHVCVAAMGAAVFLAVGTAVADVLLVQPSQDNTLYQNATGSLSNGAGTGFFAGKTQQGGIRRGLVAFDLAGVPAGATITDVSLTVHVSVSAPGSGASDFGLHRVLASWGEGTSLSEPGGMGAPATPGDATWIHRNFSTVQWTTPGGDFAAAPSATLSLGNPGTYTWTGAGLLADVQAWLSDPTSNFGWAVVGGEAANGTARRFDSRETSDPAFRPQLSITYIPAPGAAGLASMAGLLAARRRRR